MNYSKVLLAIWTAIAVYSISAFFFGTKGVIAMNTLLAERDRLQNNMEQLQNINKELDGSMDALRYDPDLLSLYARELGYGQKDERFIRIVGLQGSMRNQIAAGNMVRTVYPEGIEDKKLKITALISGVLVFLLSVVHAAFRKKEP